MNSVIKQSLTSIPHDPVWVDTYLEFITNTPTPTESFDKHHILMESIFPDFRSLTKFPWNIKRLSYADHLIAHYLLRKAIPCGATNGAFRLMVGLRFGELRASGYDLELLSDIAAEFELIRRMNDFSIKGYIRIYREDDVTVCKPSQLSNYEAEGWSLVYPEQQWIYKDDEERRVLKTDLPPLLLDGWECGRCYRATDSTKQKLSDWSLAKHKQRTAEPNGYSFIPKGDQHHRRVLGISEETKQKIRETLMGRTLAPEHADKVRVATIGKSWTWSLESRAAKSQSMTGEGNNRFGKPGYWKDKTRPQSTRDKMSASQSARTDNAFWKGKVGPHKDHLQSQKSRDQIALKLTGRIASEETRRKMREAHALRKKLSNPVK
jgi:hypothetical protein